MEPMRLTMNSLGPWPSQSASTTLLSTTPKPPSSQPNYPIVPTMAYCCNLQSLDIHPSALFRRRVHEQVPRHKLMDVGTTQYDILKDDFWCLQSTDACIRLIQLNPNLRNLTESWDDMSSFHRIRFADQLCELNNRLVIMHLSKWEVTPDKLNRLIENSPRLEILRFSKLVLKESVALGAGEFQPRPRIRGSTAAATVTQDSTATTPVLNLRQLFVFAVTHASFQFNELMIDAPELHALSISFSQVNYTQPTVNSLYSTPSSSSPWSSFNAHAHSPYHPQYPNHPPRVLWNTPRLRLLICNRTESNVATSTLLEIPQALKTVSFANYEIESRLISQVVAAQGLQLQSIRLACFSGITAQDIWLILTKCPNLVSLCAPEIMLWAGDLIPVPLQECFSDDDSTSISGCSRMTAKCKKSTTKIENWACRRLERLSVYVCLERSAVDDGQSDHYQGHQQPYERNASFVEVRKDSGLMDTDKAEEKMMASSTAQQGFLQQQPRQPYHDGGRLRCGQLQHQQQQCYENDANAGIRNAFLDQLSRLTRLRHLDLSGEHVEKVDHVQIGLPLTLSSGIECLRTLTELEHVAVTGWIEDMGVPEIDWMKRSWTKLMRISLLKTTTGEGKTSILWFLASEAQFCPADTEFVLDNLTYDNFLVAIDRFPGLKLKAKRQSRDVNVSGDMERFVEEVIESGAFDHYTDVTDDNGNNIRLEGSEGSKSKMMAEALKRIIPIILQDRSWKLWALTLVVISNHQDANEDLCSDSTCHQAPKTALTLETVNLVLRLEQVGPDKGQIRVLPQKSRIVTGLYDLDGEYLQSHADRLARNIETIRMDQLIRVLSTIPSNFWGSGAGGFGQGQEQIQEPQGGGEGRMRQMCGDMIPCCQLVRATGADIFSWNEQQQQQVKMGP
ncbi:hypothetical protein EDD11_004743 [Mortierella claussenii]|nr:hypothetical protein EDD11_004743 [Mortierella claussenii]